MTYKEYEQKKQECWEEYVSKHGMKNAIPEEPFSFTFDRAFALGKQFGNSEQVDAGTVIQGWVARDECGFLAIYKRKPERELNPYVNRPSVWNGEVITTLNEESFLSLTWSDEPIEVELTIKLKKR